MKRLISLITLVVLLFVAVSPVQIHAAAPSSSKQPNISPDGKHIAFIREVNGDSYALYLMDADGSNQKEIVPAAQVVSLSTVWSSDSKMLGITQTFPDTHSNFVYRVNTLDMNTYNWDYYLSDFTPKNDGLLFGNADPDKGEIIKSNLKGDKTDKVSEGMSPVYSPDGKQITYMEYDGGHFYIAVMDAAFNNKKRIDESNSEGQWSPDGMYIMYKQYVSSPEDWDLKVANADGSNPHTVAKVNQWIEADWSPASNSIVFTKRMESDHIAIFLMDADGNHVSQLTPDDVSSEAPQFMPSGSRILFESYRDGAMNIFTMKLDGSDVKQLTGR